MTGWTRISMTGWQRQDIKDRISMTGWQRQDINDRMDKDRISM